MALCKETGTSDLLSKTTKADCRPTLLDRAFARVADRAREYISGLHGTFDPRLAEELKQIFSDSTCPAIDYERYALPFTYTYFLTNYWKACSALVLSTPPIAHRVTDAGSGSGATGLACLAYLSSCLGDGRWTIEITFIDRCPKQIELAETFLDIIRPDLPNIEIVGLFKCMDLRDWTEEHQQSECVLLGHVLTENSQDVAAIIDHGSRSTRPDGRLLIVERTDDPIWDKIKQSQSARWQTLESAGGIAMVPERPGFYRQGADAEVRYLALAPPHRAVLAELLDAYFTAWERRNADLLDEVFTRDAEYIEKPFSTTFSGLSEIKHYWRSVVARQQNLSVNIHRVMYSDDGAFAEWTAAFDSDGHHINVKGALVINVRPGSTRAHRLREYFRTQETERAR